MLPALMWCSCSSNTVHTDEFVVPLLAPRQVDQRFDCAPPVPHARDTCAGHGARRDLAACHAVCGAHTPAPALASLSVNHQHAALFNSQPHRGGDAQGAVCVCIYVCECARALLRAWVHAWVCVGVGVDVNSPAGVDVRRGCGVLLKLCDCDVGMGCGDVDLALNVYRHVLAWRHVSIAKYTQTHTHSNTHTRTHTAARALCGAGALPRGFGDAEAARGCVDHQRPGYGHGSRRCRGARAPASGLLPGDWAAGNYATTQPHVQT
eukprot:scaffold19610_cov21-Tisochrysis_lutea.AAC.1